MNLITDEIRARIEAMGRRARRLRGRAKWSQYSWDKAEISRMVGWDRPDGMGSCEAYEWGVGFYCKHAGL